jgi:hypothetical protein
LVGNHTIGHHRIHVELVLSHEVLVPLSQNLTVHVDERVVQVVYWLSYRNFCPLVQTGLCWLRRKRFGQQVLQGVALCGKVIKTALKVCELLVVWQSLP